MNNNRLNEHLLRFSFNTKITLPKNSTKEIRMARRGNARAAKMALRKSALADDLKPVNPGEVGGQFKPLSESEVEQISATVYRILEEVGFDQATDHCIEMCKSVGAIFDESDGRLKFPRSVIDDAMNKCNRNLTLYGQDP